MRLGPAHSITETAVRCVRGITPLSFIGR